MVFAGTPTCKHIIRSQGYFSQKKKFGNVSSNFSSQRIMWQKMLVVSIFISHTLKPYRTDFELKVEREIINRFPKVNEYWAPTGSKKLPSPKH